MFVWSDIWAAFHSQAWLFTGLDMLLPQNHKSMWLYEVIHKRGVTRIIEVCMSELQPHGPFPPSGSSTNSPWIWNEYGPGALVTAWSIFTPKEVNANAALYWQIFCLNVLEWGEIPLSISLRTLRGSLNGGSWIWPCKQQLPNFGFLALEADSFSQSQCKAFVGKAAAQDAGLSEEKRLTKWVCKVFKELGLNKIENSEN